MKKFLLKIIFISIICVFVTGTFLYINSAEYKAQNFKDKYTNKIATLKPFYIETTYYCSSQNFANRGPYTACMEENLKNSSIQNYNFYMDVQNFCESLFDNLADKWNCMDEIIN